MNLAFIIFPPNDISHFITFFHIQSWKVLYNTHRKVKKCRMCSNWVLSSQCIPFSVKKHLKPIWLWIRDEKNPLSVAVLQRMSNWNKNWNAINQASLRRWLRQNTNVRDVALFARDIIEIPSLACFGLIPVLAIPQKLLCLDSREM